MYSNYPIFDEDSWLLAPSITFENMGISNSSKPSQDELPHEAPTQDHLIFALTCVYLASSRIGSGKDQRSLVRIICKKNICYLFSNR